jgi:hypothetical protein
MTAIRETVFAAMVCVAPGQGFAQVAVPGDLPALGDSILRGSADSVRAEAHARFAEAFGKLLKEPASFTADFSGLRNVSVLASPDGMVRIYTWLLPAYAAGFSYHGFLQWRDAQSKQVTTVALAEGELDRLSAEKAPLDYKRWIGALYYEIVPVKGKPPYYTLLGWRGSAKEATMKVIDVLWFDNGKPVFGKPVFSTGHGDRHRILFEYNPQAAMTLQYDAKRKMIVFDHLSPPDTSMAGVYYSYGPDFTYDAFRLKGGRWHLKTNVEPRNRQGGPGSGQPGEFRNKDLYRPEMK